jgi:hypothetical protein
MLDRGLDQAFSMNAASGAASFAFNTGGALQGGAVSNGSLYGFQHVAPGTVLNPTGPTPVAAHDMTGAQTVLGPQTPDHGYGMGVDPTTGQLYMIGTDNIIRAVNSDGSLGADIVTADLTDTINSDLDFFNNNFLVAHFAGGNVLLIDRVTGEATVFLTAAQLAAMNVGAPTGVAAVPSPSDTSVGTPEPSSLAAFGSVIVALACFHRRMRKRAAASAARASSLRT